MTVTVALPVRNGAATLPRVLAAVGEQQVDAEVEILVCDSSSGDGSDRIAREHGATVFTIRPEEFSHGGTRNLLVERAAGAHVVLLTPDAVPASPRWLAELLRGFDLAPDVALSFGPYRAHDHASARVRRELDSWFRSFAPDGQPRVDRLEDHERDLAPRRLLGPRAFFTDANGCVAKAAWQRVPYRAIPYAEDHQLALDMLSAGYAKAYMPQAAVVHSHDYTLGEQLRRSFDEWRALREVYGYTQPLGVGAMRAAISGQVKADVRYVRDAGADGPRLLREALHSAGHHTARYAGAVLGTRADRLRPAVRRSLSLERRDSFVPADPDPRPR